MGQKVDPNGLRTGVIKSWSSKWYADKAHFADNIVEDNKVRKFIKKKYYDTAISKIVLERAADKLVVAIYTARPAVLIGKAGAGVEEIKKEVEKLVSRRQESEHQHHGSQTSRCRRSTRCGRHCKTTRRTRFLPSRNETSNVQGYEGGRKGRQDDGQRQTRRC